MGRYASNSGGGDFTPAPAGTHIARSVRIIDLGTQRGEYQGKPTVRQQFVLQWELPGELIEINGEEKPMLVSKFYTNSLHEKAKLRQDLESWRAKPFTQEELIKFDLMNVLDRPAMLSIVHDERGKARVATVSGLPKGTRCPPAHNEINAFWIDEWNEGAFEALPKGFRAIIEQSDEYRARFERLPSPRAEALAKDGMGARTNDFDDDIPF